MSLLIQYWYVNMKFDEVNLPKGQKIFWQDWGLESRLATIVEPCRGKQRPRNALVVVGLLNSPSTLMQ